MGIILIYYLMNLKTLNALMNQKFCVRYATKRKKVILTIKLCIFAIYAIKIYVLCAEKNMIKIIY